MAPVLGWRWAAWLSRRVPPTSANWVAGVAAFEGAQGAASVSLAAALAATWLDPFASVMHAGIGSFCLVVGLWWRLDAVDDRVDLVRAVGRARQDAALLEATRQGEAVWWAVRLGGVAQIGGGLVATAGTYVVSVLG